MHYFESRLELCIDVILTLNSFLFLLILAHPKYFLEVVTWSVEVHMCMPTSKVVYLSRCSPLTQPVHGCWENLDWGPCADIMNCESHRL